MSTPEYDLAPGVDLSGIEKASTTHSIRFPGTDRDTIIHIRYAGPENREWENRTRGLRNRMSRRSGEAEAALRNVATLRKLLPRTIIWRVEDCPVKGGKYATFDDDANLRIFCQRLGETFLNDILSLAMDFHEFAGDYEGLSLEQAAAKGERLGN